MRELAFRGFLIFVLGILGFGIEAPRPLSAVPKDVLEVKVQHVAMDPNTLQPVVVLVEPSEERALLVWIGQCEAHAMMTELEGKKSPRPSTHDLAERILKQLNGRVKEVIITHSREGIYYATLVIEREGKPLEIDARPSDSMVLALKSKAPVFVSKRLFQEFAVPYREKREIDERYGLTSQELTAELAQSFSYRSTRGVLISDVRPGSQAEKDGWQRGDIVVEIQEKPIDDLKAFKKYFSESKTPTKIKIFRKGAFHSITLNPLESSTETHPPEKK